MTRPSLNGSAIAFDSTPATVTVSKTVAAGDVVLLCFDATSNNPGNLTITDNSSDSNGTNANWLLTATNTTDPNKVGVRYRRIANAGSITITIGKDGGASYTGVLLSYTGVHPSLFDGVSVNNYAATSPQSVVPSATNSTDTLVLGILAATDTRYAIISAYSDTLVTTNNNATTARQVHVQSRNAASGSQSAMTWTHAGGGSGTDARTTAGTINLLGVPASATLSSLTVGSKTDITVTVNVTSDQAAGTAYFALTSANSNPGVAAIKAGTGGGIISAGSVAANVGTNTKTLTGLTASTTYYLWAAQDNGSSDSSVVGSVSVTTNPPSPSIATVSNANPASGSTLTLTVTNAGSTQGSGTVTINSVAQTVTSWSDTNIAVTVSEGNLTKFGVAANIVLTGNAGFPSSPFVLTSIQPPSGWAYTNITALNATTANRITAISDLANGDQLAGQSTIGAGDIEYYNDASFSASFANGTFLVKAWTSPDGWGATGLQTVGSSTVPSKIAALLVAML